MMTQQWSAKLAGKTMPKKIITGNDHFCGEVTVTTHFHVHFDFDASFVASKAKLTWKYAEQS